METDHRLQRHPVNSIPVYVMSPVLMTTVFIATKLFEISFQDRRMLALSMKKPSGLHSTESCLFFGTCSICCSRYTVNAH